MRRIIQNGLDLIKRFEGLSRTAYPPPRWLYPTIDYGHVVEDDEDFSAALMKNGLRSFCTKMPRSQSVPSFARLI